jgi:ribosomal protein S18 acetylase RimI-like enzyme
MNYTVKNATEDMYGNCKENIFLVFDCEENYLGSGYVYPSFNFHQTYETPYLIFIGINMMDQLEGLILEDARQKLFDQLLERAMELRISRPDLSTRIYAGFPYDEDLLAFYLGNGFENDYSAIMEADITCMPNPLPNHLMVEEWDLRTDQDLDEYEAIYNEIFVSPLDRDQYREQQKEKNFMNLTFSIEGRKEAGCTIFEKDGYGYIETVYVSEGKRGTGLARNVMEYIFAYFTSIGIRKSKLEVWKINKRAIALYESYGFREVDRNLMFPGITR